jgi:hypothetical protein
MVKPEELRQFRPGGHTARQGQDESPAHDFLRTSARAIKRDDTMACLRAMVVNRLCDPGSKLGVLRWLAAVAVTPAV